jgi:hypothetical protein
MNAFVIDFVHTDAGGSIQVFDLKKRRRVTSLPTRYAPEIAVAPDGRLLVADFDPDSCEQRAELRIYDAQKFSLQQRIAIGPRTRYNAGPAAPSMVVTADSKLALVHLVDTIGNDLAHHTIGVIDLARGQLRKKEGLIAPEHVLAFGLIGNSARTWIAMNGRELAGLGWGDATRSPDLDGFFQSIDLRHRGHLNAIAAAAAEPGGKRVWLVSREARLVVADLVKRRVERAPAIGLPGEWRVPVQQIAVGRDRLFLGLGADRSAWAGRAERIAVFALDGLRHLYDVALVAPSYWMELAPDGRTLAVLSEVRRSLTLYNAADGRPIGSLTDVATAPLALAITRA